jgi:hypothetical protein
VDDDTPRTADEVRGDGLVLLYGVIRRDPSPVQLVEWLVLRPNVDTRLSHSRSVSPRGFRVGTRNFYPEMGRSMEIQNQEFFILLSLARRCLAFGRVAVVLFSLAQCSPATPLRMPAGLRLVLVIDCR